MNKFTGLIIIYCVGLFSAVFANDPNYVATPDQISVTAYENGQNPNPKTVEFANNSNDSLRWYIDAAENPAWLSTDPNGRLPARYETRIRIYFDITGLAAGDYSHTLIIKEETTEMELETIDVQLRVFGPKISLSQNSFNVYALQGGADPDPNTFTISNTGTQYLNWSIDTAEQPSWLNINPLHGSVAGGTSENVTLSYHISGLTTGQYSYRIWIADPMAGNSPQPVTVKMNISGPVLKIDPVSFQFIFNIASLSSLQKLMKLTNSGLGVVNWSADLSAKPDWLTVSPTAGSLGQQESENVTLSVNASGLSSGQYEYMFDVSDPILPDSHHEILVRLLANELEWDILVPDDYPTIQAAIDAAQYGNRIHVANGTYIENITLKTGVILTGESTEECIIDSNQNGFASVVANKCDSNTVLEGFTITNSNATGLRISYSELIVSKCLITANSALHYNGTGTPYYGGGVYLLYSNSNLQDCIIEGNTAKYAGGGVFAYNSIINLQDCMIEGNTAPSGGGGLYCQGTTKAPCSSKITNCTFINNTSYAKSYYDASDGGGVCLNGISPIFTNCEFNNNTASKGGAIFSDSGAPVLFNCTFKENSAIERGGGVYNTKGSLVLTGCMFSDNTANSSGGGIFISSSVLDLTNCVFSGNSADKGGGMLLQSGNAKLVNSTFYGNSATHGGGIYNGCNSAVINCIIWNNKASSSGNEIRKYSVNGADYPVIYNSDISGSGGSGNAWNTSLGTNGGGNIDVDPLFVDPNDRDYHLLPGSPCIDAGYNTSLLLVSTDLDGYSRYFDDPNTQDTGNGQAPIVDIGAYESDSSASDVEIEIPQGVTIWVNPDFTPSGNNGGHIWGLDAFRVIQDGIDAAVYGDVIHVGPGVYVENIVLKKGVALIGSGQTETIINGGRRGPVVMVEYCDSNTLLKGFRIIGGFHQSSGGGLYNRESSPTITDCAFVGNEGGDGGGMNIFYGAPYISNCIFDINIASAESDSWGGQGKGGGIYSSYAYPTIDHCTFRNNSSNADGGGLYKWGGNPVIRNCIFTDNSAVSAGGGIRGNSMNNTNCLFVRNNAKVGGGGASEILSFVDCQFVDNVASEQGGGLYIIDDTPNYGFLIDRCQFINNTATRAGAGLYIWGGSSKSLIHNCVFIGNSANTSFSYGGGIYAANFIGHIEYCTFSNNGAMKGGGMYNGGSDPTITNSIFWGNTASTASGIFGGIITYSNIQGGHPGTGNINTDPLFINRAEGNLRLSKDSPCIDAGNPNYVSDPTETDLDGNPRFLGSAVDMGAYEYIPNIRPVADAGADQVVFAWIDSLAQVQLDGTGSFDPDGDVLEYFWFDGNELIAMGAEPNVVLGIGKHVINLIVSDGIDDSEPYACLVTVIEPLMGRAAILPQSLNRDRRGRYVIGWLMLPKRVSAKDVDQDEPLSLLAGDAEIAAQRQYVLSSGRQYGGQISVVAFFDTAALLDAISEENQTGVTLVTRLTSGQTAYGVDKIRIIESNRKKRGQK